MSALITEPCRSCTAPVAWCDTTTGKSMPVDLEPSKTGSLAVEERDGRRPVARFVKPHLRSGETLHMSHFVTCPHAGDWRSRGRAS